MVEDWNTGIMYPLRHSLFITPFLQRLCDNPDCRARFISLSINFKYIQIFFKRNKFLPVRFTSPKASRQVALHFHTSTPLFQLQNSFSISCVLLERGNLLLIPTLEMIAVPNSISLYLTICCP